MRFTRTITMALAAVAVSGLLVAGALAATSTGSADHDMSGMTMTTAAPKTAADLRVALDNLFGEHAVLAMNATNAGVTGSKSFPAAAKALDSNSVALSKAIASVYGAKAGQTFLNGKFMWRDHIKFFVNYTVARRRRTRPARPRPSTISSSTPSCSAISSRAPRACRSSQSATTCSATSSSSRVSSTPTRRATTEGGIGVPRRVQPHVHDR